jgi:electron transport complex protein RnfB
VDAILGAHKFMHTVLLDECIGCGLCVAPCPVDCIEMVDLQSMLPPGTEVQKNLRAQRAKTRHKARQLRLQQEAQRQIPVFVDRATRKAQIKKDLQEILKRKQQKNDPDRG